MNSYSSTCAGEKWERSASCTCLPGDSWRQKLLASLPPRQPTTPEHFLDPSLKIRGEIFWPPKFSSTTSIRVRCFAILLTLLKMHAVYMYYYVDSCRAFFKRLPDTFSAFFWHAYKPSWHSSKTCCHFPFIVLTLLWNPPDISPTLPYHFLYIVLTLLWNPPDIFQTLDLHYPAFFKTLRIFVQQRTTFNCVYSVCTVHTIKPINQISKIAWKTILDLLLSTCVSRLGLAWLGGGGGLQGHKGPKKISINHRIKAYIYIMNAPSWKIFTALWRTIAKM